jgi:hypothetical protein
MRAQVVDVVEKHSPERTDLKFDEIESNSVSLGDMIARMVIEEALKEQAAIQPAEVEAARQSLAREAHAIDKAPEQLRLTHIPKKHCQLGTLRGPVSLQREYLYFPELKTGIFPPR